MGNIKMEYRYSDIDMTKVIYHSYAWKATSFLDA